MSSREKVLEKETRLFLHLNGVLHSPSAWSFLCVSIQYESSNGLLITYDVLRALILYRHFSAIRHKMSAPI